ncbi:MAG: phage head morphogenesis protein [Lachnospiraceae bacterium]|nr:phage head morphogenesis protein [Lachnospiraceae bacterium]
MAEQSKTPEEYRKWRKSQIMAGERWKALQNTIAKDLYNANVAANNIARSSIPEIYAINFNFGIYEVETTLGIDTGFTLYNKDAVMRIIEKDPAIYKRPGAKTAKAIKEGKIIRWNKQKVQSVMIQGILQGESIPNLAKRLAKETCESDYGIAIRNARTMTTGIQNAGRLDAYARAEKMGVNMEQEWRAVLDNRTRHDHRLLDGQRRKIGEAFEVDGIKIKYPGDIGAPSYMIYNCRCTVRGVVAGLEPRSRKYRDDTAIKGVSYDTWQNTRQSESNPITLQAEKGEAMRNYYIRMYRNGGRIKN